MSSDDRCRECGTVIPLGSPGGLCGRCLFGLALAHGEATPAVSTSGSAFKGVSDENSARGFLDLPPQDCVPASPGRAGPPLTEKAGDKIGRYQLLEAIGEGGFGVVYMAQQKEPLERRVALKIIKLGMDTKQVVARFEAERQALALMDHPNIAKVLDAGATETGRPYFVMELVHGIKITDFCDQHHLPTRERLELLVQVARAIQHAHQKGIIHRDVKPSNILVTLRDGVPVPKVIDFGIAKATQQALTDKTVFTQFQQFIGTPAYMSPEQAETSGLGVDTRSDIYALGVLLYELLTGKTPFDGQELAAAGLEEMRRTIREQEPLRPSTRLGRLRREELTTTAQSRRCNARKLISLLQGDLDWIVMKCLEKDRTRRYETANGLAADIQRHLSQEPVVARPPSTVYRLQKFVRRNKVKVTAAAVVATVLVLGVIVSTWLAVQARRAQTNEVRQRRRAEEGELAARQNLYSADMSLAYQAWQENNLGVALELLDKHRPGAGQVDLRGWEWRYLWGLCQSEARYSFATKEHIATRIALAPGGAILASAGEDITIWDVGSQRPVETLGVVDAARAVAFSPDGRSLAFTTWNHGLKLWDVGRHRESGQFPDNPGSRWKSALAFSPDGRTLAVAGEKGRILLWNIETKTAVTLQGHEGEVRTLLFLPDGQTLISGGEDFAVRFWSVASRQQITNFTSHTDWVQALALSPDGKTLASASWDNTIRVWDVPARRPITVLTNHTAQVSTVAFSPSGKILASGAADHSIKLWNTTDWREASTLKGHLQEVVSLAFSPVGTDLFSAAKDGAIMTWNAQPTPFQTDRLKRPADSRWWGLGLFLRRGYPIRVWTFADSGTPICRHTNGTFNLWNPTTLEPLPGHPEPACMDQAAGLALSRDGKRLAFATKEGSLVLWDVDRERKMADLPWLRSEHAILAFSPDAKLIAAAAPGLELTVWDLGDMEKIQRIATLPKAASMPVDGVLSFAADGKTLAVGNDDGTIEIWNLRRKERVGLWQVEANVHGGPALQTLSPDGTMLAIVLKSDGSLRLCEIATRHEKLLARTLNGFFCAAFAPDGQRVVAGSADGSIWIWNPRTGQEVAHLQGHSGSGRADKWVVGLSFLADGNTLISSTSESVRVWHAPSWGDIESAKRSR